MEVEEVEQPNPEKREQVTVIKAVSASGHKVPPFIILAGQTLKNKAFDNCLNNCTVITPSPNSYTDN